MIGAGKFLLKAYVVVLPGKGFYQGGNTGASYVTTANKILYSTDTRSTVTSANLTQGKFGHGGVSKAFTAGYTAGGHTGGTMTVVAANKLTFSTEVNAAKTTANLSYAAYELGSISESSAKGFFAGGWNGNSRFNTMNKLTYSTETRSTMGATLGLSRNLVTGLSGNSTKGYFVGGDIQSDYTNYVEKLTYSSETVAASTASYLSTKKSGVGAITGKDTHGYVAAGLNPFPGTYTLTTEKITYSNDVRSAATSANLGVARFKLCGLSATSTKGYLSGGYSNSAATATTDKITFSNDTRSAQTSANLSQALYDLSSVGELGG